MCKCFTSLLRIKCGVNSLICLTFTCVNNKRKVKPDISTISISCNELVENKNKNKDEDKDKDKNEYEKYISLINDIGNLRRLTSEYH